MDDLTRLKKEYEIEVLGHEHLCIRVQLMLQRHRRRRRNRQRRRVWIRPWVRRMEEFGIYDQLLVELRWEDMASFVNFLRMPPCDVRRTPGTCCAYDIQAEESVPSTFGARPEAGFDTAPPCFRLKIRGMPYAWIVPQNTMGLAVKEVCQAIVEECKDELMTCPTTPPPPMGGAKLLVTSTVSGTVPHCLGALDGKHVAMKCPFRSGSLYHSYKDFFLGGRPTIRIGGRKLKNYLG